MPTTTVNPSTTASPTTTTTTSISPTTTPPPIDCSKQENDVRFFTAKVDNLERTIANAQKQKQDLQAQKDFWKPLYETWYGPPVPTNQQLEETRQYYQGLIAESKDIIKKLEATRSDPNAPSVENEIDAEKNRLGNLQTKLNAGYANTPAASELLNYHANEPYYNATIKELGYVIDEAQNKLVDPYTGKGAREDLRIAKQNLALCLEAKNNSASAQEVLQNYQDWYAFEVTSQQNSQIYKTGFLA